MSLKRTLKNFSIVDSRGSSTTPHRGIVDVLTLKQSKRRMLLAKGLQLFGQTSWAEGKVANYTDPFEAWFELGESGNVSWRSGRSPAAVAWTNLLVELVFGQLHDAALKMAVKTPNQRRQCWMP